MASDDEEYTPPPIEDHFEDDDNSPAEQEEEKKDEHVEEPNQDETDYTDWPRKAIKEPHPNDVLYGRG